MSFTLGKLLQEQARRRPEAACLTYDERTFTFREVEERANRVANAILQKGQKRGDRIAILGRNSHVFYELAFGCAKAGTIMLPINWRLSAREVTDILADAEPGLLLIESEFLDKLEAMPDRDQIETIEIEQSYSAWRDAASSEDPGAGVSSEDIAYMLYTSGTTGKPKGVMLTHENLSYTARMAKEVWRFTEESVNLVAMPLFHIGGLGYGLLALSQGGHTVLLQQPAPQPVLDAIVSHRVTHGFFVPAVIQNLVETSGVDSLDLSSMELIVYGASPINETLLLRALKIFKCGFTHAYGLTETAGTVITLPPEDHDPGGKNAERLRSCGKPVPWVEAGLFNPETESQVPQGEVGEIWIRSGMNMLGYWNKPEETAKTITSEGWLRTGDAAYCDPEGYFYIHDRYKDLIVSGGENIYPTEIENVLYEHPAIAETAVIGVSHERWGETPKAIVVLRPGVSCTESEIMDFVRERLARYKCPTSVSFTDVLPRNASGKVLKGELRAMNASKEEGKA